MSERLNAGLLLAVVGAITLFVSLFLDWYEPGVSAWTVFEVVDLLLAIASALVVVALVAELARRPLGIETERWLPVVGGGALLLVVVSIVNNPPAAIGLDEDAGAWIGLAGAILMGIGALLAQRQIAIVISSTPRERRDRPSGSSFSPRPPGQAAESGGSDEVTRVANPVDRR